jgi:mannose-6-phosphate isomerase-like protein (cupin superfamily)
MPYTIKNLLEVKDSAPEFRLDQIQEARFATGDLGAQQTGLSHHVLKPGKRQPFGHRHNKAEEIYLVLAGDGKIKLGDSVEMISAMDAIRIPPKTPRMLEAGHDGLEFIAFGPHHKGDAEMLEEDFWPHD